MLLLGVVSYFQLTRNLYIDLASLTRPTRFQFSIVFTKELNYLHLKVFNSSDKITEACHFQILRNMTNIVNVCRECNLEITNQLTYRLI